MLRLFFLARLQKQKRNKKTREVISNQMNKRQEKIQDEIIKGMYKIFDKLEKRIATLEKVLESHAKCIGELRGKE